MSSDNHASGGDRVKIAFRLMRDEEDWPPADWEHLWAIPRGTQRYELDNIPFFVKGVACGDVVSAQSEDQGLVFDRVLLRGGHSTVRVIMYDLAQKQAIRDSLKE